MILRAGTISTLGTCCGVVISLVFQATLRVQNSGANSTRHFRTKIIIDDLQRTLKFIDSDEQQFKSLKIQVTFKTKTVLQISGKSRKSLGQDQYFRQAETNIDSQQI